MVMNFHNGWYLFVFTEQEVNLFLVVDAKHYGRKMLSIMFYWQWDETLGFEISIKIISDDILALSAS